MMTPDIIFDQKHQLTADIYQPDTPNGAAIVFAHGGGWLRGDKANEHDIGDYFAAAGYLVAIPNYRLAPASIAPAAQVDFDAFIDWFKASDFEFDRNRIGLLGASVGGTMTLTTSLKTGYPTVSWSGILDFELWFAQHTKTVAALDAKTELGLTDPHAIHESFYKYFITNYVKRPTPENLAAINPVDLLSSKIGPTLLFNSADELTPLSGALAFIKKAATLNREVALQIVPGTGHARDYTDYALVPTLNFFNRQLR